MTIEQNLARYRELDKARTQGEWELNCHTYDGNHLIDIGTKTTTVSLITEGEDSWLEDRANAAFIASAPSILRDLETAVEALKLIAGCPEEHRHADVLINIARNALAAEKMGEPTSRSE